MGDPIRILIIEDDRKISRFLELELTHEGYDVQAAFDGRTGLEQAQQESCDLILLDVMIPGINGIEVCRRIRKSSDVPVIMLTAKDGITDRVMGLDSGADDYLTKPFAIEELLARIRSLLRRNKDRFQQDHAISSDKSRTEATGTSPLKIMIGDLSLDMERHLVTKSDKVVELSKKEFDLLAFLMINNGIVLSREKILEHVWGYDFDGETNVIDVYIRYLRSKIDEPFHDNMIRTIRGVGYVIREKGKEE
jgi:DNA-binding response OmpR family regulator